MISVIESKLLTVCVSGTRQGRKGVARVYCVVGNSLRYGKSYLE